MLWSRLPRKLLAQLLCHSLRERSEHSMSIGNEDPRLLTKLPSPAYPWECIHNTPWRLTSKIAQSVAALTASQKSVVALTASQKSVAALTASQKSVVALTASRKSVAALAASQ
eukprot:11228364-Lingulodinium_polyedra.AAC.10